MALIGSTATCHAFSNAVGKPQYSSKPATCPMTSNPHGIINFRSLLFAIKSLSPTSSFLLYPDELVCIIATPLRLGEKF